MISFDNPACSGAHGPGDMMIASGGFSASSVRSTASLRTIMRSRPSMPT
jgi:hypothetical protein